MTGPAPRPPLAEPSLDALLAASGIAFGAIDRGLRLTAAGGALESGGGRPLPGAVGRTLAEALPDLAPSLEPAVRAILDGGAPIAELEHVVAAPGFPWGWRAWLGSYLPRAAGAEPDGVVFVLRDVTARRREERLLKAQEAVHRIVATAADLDGALLGILEAIGRELGWEVGGAWFVDEPAGLIRNHAVWRLRPDLGAAFEETTRRTSFPRGVGLPGRVWASGEPAWVVDVVADTNFPRAAIALADGLHGAFALPIWRRNRVIGVLEFFASQLMPSDRGLLEAMEGLGHTVGQFVERQHAEAALRDSEMLKSAILETALDCIISMDHEGQVVEFNPAAERAFGYARDQVLGRPLADLIVPPELREAHRRGLAHYLRTGEGPVLGRRVEMPAVRADGSRFACELAILRIPGPGPPVFTAHLRDISDRRRFENEREELLARERAARQEAEAANRSKDEFLATLSHELRTPLSAVLGWTVLLRTGRLASHLQPGALEAIERNARTQAQLIEDLLDVSRIVAGKLHLDARLLAMRPVVEGALAAVRPALEAKRIQLESRLSADTFVRGDAVRLQQVAWNLLTNAAKFTPSGGRIEVGLEADGAEVALTVRDNGIGLAPEFLPHAFERLRQADMGISRVHGGLGIGLSLVRHLVELHGGTVAAESPGAGQGATFTVRLPRAEPEDLPRAAEPPPAAGLSGLRVLCVDDDRDNLELVLATLAHAGAEARGARSAAQALETLESWPPDLLVSDLGMPEVDGYELIRRVRASAAPWADLPAIALTAHGSAEDRDRSIEAGYQVHLAKPVDPEALIGALAALRR